MEGWRPIHASQSGKWGALKRGETCVEFQPKPELQANAKSVFWSLQNSTLSHVPEFALVIHTSADCRVLQACSFSFSDLFLQKSQVYKKFYIYYLTISFDYWCPGHHSCKKCFCLRDLVFWGRIFLILRRNFPNMEEDFPNIEEKFS